MASRGLRAAPGALLHRRGVPPYRGGAHSIGQVSVVLPAHHAVPDSVALRALSWPSDLPQLERLDTAFSTDVVYEVRSAQHGFELVERSISPTLRKQYHVMWDQLAMSSAAIVAVREGALVGVGALEYVAWNRRAILSHLYVDREARGRGIGKRLIQELHARANALHARCLWAETQNVNAPAIRFYESCGFVFSGLDTSLYAPQDGAGETALYFALPSHHGAET